MAASSTKRADVLAALRANGGNVTRTARDTRTARSTIIRWRDEHENVLAAAAAADAGPDAETPSVLPDSVAGDAAARLPGVLESLEAGLGVLAKDLLTDLRDPLKRAAAPLKETATAFGIVTDKLLLLKGMPTARTEQLNPDLLTAELAGLLALNDPPVGGEGGGAGAPESSVDTERVW